MTSKRVFFPTRPTFLCAGPLTNTLLLQQRDLMLSPQLLLVRRYGAETTDPYRAMNHIVLYMTLPNLVFATSLPSTQDTTRIPPHLHHDIPHPLPAFIQTCHPGCFPTSPTNANRRHSSNYIPPAPDPIPNFPNTNVASAYLILLTGAGRDEEVHLGRLRELREAAYQGGVPLQVFKTLDV